MNNQSVTVQTPLEKLISDKQQILAQCKIQEQKLNEDFSYIQENAGSLLLSGVSSLLFSGSKSSTKATNKDNASVPANGATASIGMSDFLSIAKGLIPVAWEVAQPIIMTWGINKVKNWFFGHLFKKKK